MMVRCADVVFLLLSLFSVASESMEEAERARLKEKARGMFYHGYNGYMTYAYPFDELKPISCVGQDTWGSYSLTLIDSLDTLLILGNSSEFRRVVHVLTETLTFDIDINVSVFETNIRVIGGLLSAHLLSARAGIVLEEGWPCQGPLLRLAVDAAERLLPAFETKTGMPYGTVNLLHGVPPGETPVTCTAACGTYILEFGTLSRLTGDKRFEEAALRALDGLWKHRSSLGLVGNHINVQTGAWTAKDAGIGAGVDSYFEYLIKGGLLFASPPLMDMFSEMYKKVEKYLKVSDWYVWVHMDKGQVTMPIFQSLEAFWPGVQTLWGDISSASRTMQKYHSVWRHFGFIPEFYQIPGSSVMQGRESYPLRPELVESAMYLYQATKDHFFLEVGRDIMESIEHSSKTECGYATVRDVRTHIREDRMESFFLAETTKYLYLLFDEENFIHSSNGSVWQTPEHRSPSHCPVGSAGYVFNTEAHPIDIGAINCCHKSALFEVPAELTDWENLSEERRVELYRGMLEGAGDVDTFDGTATCKARPFVSRLSTFIDDSKMFNTP